jgi:L-alanine-DL-glutamate epimerase-like enolase superfamily enzyme
MRIVRAEVTDLVLPKEDPEWRFALGARPEHLAVVVRLEADTGLVGFGSGGEVPHLGYPFAALKGLAVQLAGKLTGADPRDRRPLLAGLEREASGCPPCRAAFELALYDLLAKAAGLPLYQYLGGAFRKSIPILRILPLKDPSQVAAGARKLAEEGYRYLKIKLDAEDPDLDAARVAAVRQAVGESVHLTLDANQSYTPKGAIDLYRHVARYRIDLFEQPVRDDDVDGLCAVTEAVDCVVEADESASSLAAIHRLVALRAVDSISLKVNKLGGLDPMAEAAVLCRAANVSCRVGATVGSALLTAAAMQFVAATPNIGYACELGEFERLRGDVFGGLAVKGGQLEVPELPGLGAPPA